MSWVWFKAFIFKSEVLKIHDANVKQQNPVVFNCCNMKGVFYVSGVFFQSSVSYILRNVSQHL